MFLQASYFQYEFPSVPTKGPIQQVIYFSAIRHPRLHPRVIMQFPVSRLHIASHPGIFPGRCRRRRLRIPQYHVGAADVTITGRDASY